MKWGVVCSSAGRVGWISLLFFLVIQVDFFRGSVDVKQGTDGVMIVHYADGKATGDAFALFNNEEELTKALQLTKSMIGSRYVELFKSSLKEFEMVRK